MSINSSSAEYLMAKSLPAYNNELESLDFPPSEPRQLVPPNHFGKIGDYDDVGDCLTNETSSESSVSVQNSSAGTISFDEFIDWLGRTDDFALYMSSTVGLFDHITRSAPRMVNRQLHTHYGSSEETSKKGIVNVLDWIYAQMCESDFDTYPLAIPKATYLHINHEQDDEERASYFSSSAFYYPNGFAYLRSVHLFVSVELTEFTDAVPAAVMSDMVSCVGLLWNCQHTRLFVPCILVHGNRATLFVFGRGGYYSVDIGMIFGVSFQMKTEDVSALDRSLRQLWFLMKQPSESFGHFVDIARSPQFVEFNRNLGTVTVNAVNTHTAAAVSIADWIEKEVSEFGRAAFLFNTDFGEEMRPAVFKLCWAPIGDAQENVIYMTLLANKVEGVPKIYSSGVISQDILGYQLVYLVMEHCGDSLGTVFEDCGQNVSNFNQLRSVATDAIQQVCSCLLQAKKAGVLHCDILPDNIMVRNGNVFVVGWGHACVLRDSVMSNNMRDFILRMGGSFKPLQNNNKYNGKVTYANCFRSMRILIGHTYRSVMDDFESLFYVVVRCFSCVGTGNFDYRAGLLKRFCGGEYVAMRLSMMVCQSNYPCLFGVNERFSDNVQQLLAPLCRLLFSHGDSNFVRILLTCHVDPRPDSYLSFREVLGESNYFRIYLQLVKSTKTRVHRTKKPMYSLYPLLSGALGKDGKRQKVLVRAEEMTGFEKLFFQQVDMINDHETRVGYYEYPEVSMKSLVSVFRDQLKFTSALPPLFPNQRVALFSQLNETANVAVPNVLERIIERNKFRNKKFI